MSLSDQYLNYIRAVRRYSPRTVSIYGDTLKEFEEFAGPAPESLTAQSIRNYEVELMDARGLDPRTVNLRLSVLSGFCKYLLKQGVLTANPARTVARPRMPKNLPVFYREDAMRQYFADTAFDASAEALDILSKLPPEPQAEMYRKRLDRMIMSLLFSTGIRRSELISLTRSSADLSRRVLRVRGKGDKMREIPLVPSLCEEISLYLQAADIVTGTATQDMPLLRTASGTPVYPVYVDRVVKSGLGAVGNITGRKSPHVLRHTLATELLDGGTDLNSIKELLGHSSLAATQVYTHNTVERLKSVYNQAHPRAKNEGENGDQD